MSMLTSMESTYLTVEPVPYEGTTSDKEANWNSHNFVLYGYDEVLCGRCDASTYGQAAFYPCGSDIPYQARLFFEDGREEIHRLPMNYTWDDIDQLTRKEK